MIKNYETTIGGRTLSLETGRLAGQANGAVLARYGDTVVLATAVAAKTPREGVDFFPLTVDFEERLYAAGKIPGSFFRREGRPSELAILTCRLVDRPIRPLFPEGFRNDVQIIITALSADQENEPDVLAVNAASAALNLSDIPWSGPIGAVRIGYIDDQFVVNPVEASLADSRLNLVVAGTREAILMVEASAREVSERLVLEALRLAHDTIQDIITMQEQMRLEVGKPKTVVTMHRVDEAVRQAVLARVGDRLAQALSQPDKAARGAAVDELTREMLEAFRETFAPQEVQEVLDEEAKRLVRSWILEEGRRPDGRALDEVRPISCEVGLLPRTHGTGLFTRGETQALTIATLGTPRDEQMLDGLTLTESKRYMHHYNFPPYSTGEARPLRGPSRRAIGHGALAERALLPVLPDEEQFPYTIRLVSEILSSNGSTSMASVCGSTLALMDAGVPIRAPVAGVAMGLIIENGRYRILTDIQGIEDHLGDMDFKVAGTREGITALQMDIKVSGITPEIMAEALEQARRGRLHILDEMEATIAQARPDLSPYAPRLVRIKIDPEKIGTIIGPGGKMIRAIQEETNTQIDIEDDGTVTIASTNGVGSDLAVKKIRDLTEEVEVGKIYLGTVKRLMDFGAFVEILPGKEGLVRVGELADYYVSRVEDVVKVGDEIMVMVTEIDHMGRVNLSRRAVLEGRTTPGEARGASNRRGDRREGGRDRNRGERDRRGDRDGAPRGGDRPPRRRPRSRGDRPEGDRNSSSPA